MSQIFSGHFIRQLNECRKTILATNFISMYRVTHFKIRNLNGLNYAFLTMMLFLFQKNCKQTVENVNRFLKIENRITTPQTLFGFTDHYNSVFGYVMFLLQDFSAPAIFSLKICNFMQFITNYIFHRKLLS